jgi:hypothetical protein
MPYQKQERVEGKDCILVVQYGFDVKFARDCNQAPHFSITAEMYEPYRQPGEPRKRHSNGKTMWLNSCGCLHDDIRKMAPHLAPLIRWHLVAVGEGPMHYVANAIYWMEKVHGISQWEQKSYDPDPMAAFKSTVCWCKWDNELNIPPAPELSPMELRDIQNTVLTEVEQGATFEPWTVIEERILKRKREILAQQTEVFCAARWERMMHDCANAMVKFGIDIPSVKAA